LDPELSIRTPAGAGEALTSNPAFMSTPSELCAVLQPLLAAELAAGNRVVDCGTSLYQPNGVLVVLAADFKRRPATLPPDVYYVEVNDPQWWKAELVHRPTGHVLAARFG
jgi:hypothetical protein